MKEMSYDFRSEMCSVYLAKDIRLVFLFELLVYSSIIPLLVGLHLILMKTFVTFWFGAFIVENWYLKRHYKTCSNWQWRHVVGEKWNDSICLISIEHIQNGIIQNWKIINLLLPLYATLSRLFFSPFTVSWNQLHQLP